MMINANDSAKDNTSPDVRARPSRGVLAMTAVVLCAVLAACENNDGPMEKAGERIDEATTDVGNAVEDACENAKEGAGAADTRC
jgi:hypothetical protein